MKYLNMGYFSRSLTIGLLLFATCGHAQRQNANVSGAKVEPQIAIVFVIDQLAGHEVQKLSKFLDGGIGKILHKGTNFTQTYVPNGISVTATQHTGLSTGTTSDIHGIIDNSWYDAQGKEIDAFAGQKPDALMADTVNKYVCNKETERECWTFSYKDRAAIGMAGKEGTAVWFDDSVEGGRFTSSASYLKKMPDWLEQFNDTHHVPASALGWKLAYAQKPTRYQFPLIDNYDLAKPLSKNGAGESLIAKLRNKPMPETRQDFFQLYEETPAADQLVLDAAFAYIKHALARDKNAKMLVWISLSSLDKVGHKFGPESREAIDTIYHMDIQIKRFKHKLEKLLSKNGTLTRPLYVLVADHGVMPIPELHGNKRLMRSAVIDAANDSVEQKYGIKKIVQAFTGQYLYVDESKLAAGNKDAIIATILETLKKIPGIRGAYTLQELAGEHPEGSPEWMMANSVYKGRSGQIFVLSQEDTIVTKYKTGTGHGSIYEFDTHVPLAIWWPGHIGQATVNTKVWAPQLANTLSFLLTGKEMPGKKLSRLPLAQTA